MYFKISNTAKKEVLEEWSKASLKYPNLYKPQIIINGLNEVTIPIITMEDKQSIALSIWGILPEKYSEDWSIFQNITNTLNLHEDSMNSNLWYADALYKRRGLVPVTGFFTSLLRQGQAYPHYVSRKDGKPFYLASIYNKLEDGFITTSLIVGKANEFIRTFHNVTDCMPLIIPERHKWEWLDVKTSLTNVKQILSTSFVDVLQAHPIAKEFFNNDISYDTMLSPYVYSDSSPE